MEQKTSSINEKINSQNNINGGRYKGFKRASSQENIVNVMSGRSVSENLNNITNDRDPKKRLSYNDCCDKYSENQVELSKNTDIVNINDEMTKNQDESPNYIYIKENTSQTVNEKDNTNTMNNTMIENFNISCQKIADTVDMVEINESKTKDSRPNKGGDQQSTCLTLDGDKLCENCKTPGVKTLLGWLNIEKDKNKEHVKLINELKSRNKQLENVEKELSATLKKIDMKEEENNRLLAKISTLQHDRLNMVKIQDDFENCNSNFLNFKLETVKLKSDIDFLKDELDTKNEKMINMDEENNMLKEDVKSLNEQIELLKTELSQPKVDVMKSQKVIKDLKLKLKGEKQVIYQ